MDGEDAREPGPQLPAHRRGNLVAVANINLHPTNQQTKGYHTIIQLNSTDNYDNAYILIFMPPLNPLNHGIFSGPSRIADKALSVSTKVIVLVLDCCE